MGKADALKKLNGIGNVLAPRFVKAGLDTPEKLAAATPEQLCAVKGVTVAAANKMIAAARKAVGGSSISRDERIAGLKRTAAGLRKQVESLAGDVRERFKDELASKAGKKAEKEFLRLLACIEGIEKGVANKLKKTARRLSSTEKRLVGMGMSGLKEIGRGLRKTRKSFEKLSS